MTDLQFYSAEDGSAPFEKWFASLEASAAAKVTVAVSRLERGAVSSVKSVGDGVFEYRIDWGPGYRVYFGQDGLALIILLTGGTKRRQQRDIEASKVSWADYKRRKSER